MTCFADRAIFYLPANSLAVASHNFVVNSRLPCPSHQIKFSPACKICQISIPALIVRARYKSVHYTVNVNILGHIDGKQQCGGVQGVQAHGQGPGQAQAVHQGGQAHTCIQELSLQVQ